VSLLETVLVDGTDLSTLAQGITDISGVFDVAPRRGTNYVLPGANGATYVAKPLDALTFSLGIAIMGKDPTTGVLAATDQLRAAQLIANYRTLVSLVKAETGGTVTLTRKLSTLAGSSTTETCTAEVIGGIQANPVTNSLMRVVVSFVNLSGKWA
jgi:hypothetical protein